MLLTLTRGHRAAPLLVLGAILCLPNATRGQQPDASNCGNGSGPEQMLTLSWAEVPTEESLSALPDGQLHLLEINRSPQSIRVEVQVIADGGTAERISVALPPFSLAAGTRRSVPVQLDALGLSLNDM